MRTGARLALGTVAMLLLAQINPNFLRRSTPWLYAVGCLLLLVVAAIGHIGKGAQRWLDLGLFRFQPSELMKLAVPMMCAWYLHERPLPPGWPSLAVLAVLIFVPVGLVAVQPDLGTAALIAIAGALVIVLAGLRLRVIAALFALGARRRLVRLELHARLPAQARAHLPRSADRSARAPATTSSSRRSRSAPAGCSARAG